MGHAMEALLHERHELVFHDEVQRTGVEPINFEAEAAKAGIVLLCVPAEPHQSLLESLVSLILPETVCLSIAKGLDQFGRIPAQIYQDVFNSKYRHALLYGPMISEEIRAGHQGFADLWCSDAASRILIHELFAGSRLLLRDTGDRTGISWAVVLKNVYAMAFGIADELELGVNVRGYLTVTALHELSGIVRDKGGDPATPFHLAGLGDLVTTATSEDSHHHEVGRRLARGENEGIDGEGPHTLQMVEKYGLIEPDRYPLFSLVRDIVKTPVRARQLFEDHLNSA